MHGSFTKVRITRSMSGREKSNSKIVVLLTLISINSVLVCTSNIVATKMVEIAGITFAASAFIYAFTFLITDIISEVWGEPEATCTVWAGIISNTLMMILVYVAINLPPSPLWADQDSFERILGNVPRIVFASILAYSISQHLDVKLFHKIKERTHGKHLWLRNNLSTISAQLVDSAVFFVVGFAGVLPWQVLLSTAVAQYLIKITIALVDTGIIYPAKAMLDRKFGKEE